MIDTIKGAEASAVLYSLAETSRANGLRSYEYFSYLLTELLPNIFMILRQRSLNHCFHGQKIFLKNYSDNKQPYQHLDIKNPSLADMAAFI